MNRLLALLLGASILANAVLIARASRHTCGTPPGSPPKIASADDLATVRAELVAERKRSAALEEKIAASDHMPIKEGGMKSADTAAAKSTKSMRDRLRKLIEMSKAGKDRDDMNPEAMAEMMSFYSEIVTIFGSPSKNAAQFAAFMSDAVELTVDVSGTPLTAEQQKSLDALRTELEEGLLATPASPATERQIAEITLQAEWYRKATGLLSPDQQARLMEDDMLAGLSAMSMMSSRPVSTSTAAKDIASDWIKMLGASDSQKPYIESAASLFAQTLTQNSKETLVPLAGSSKDPLAGYKVLEHRTKTLRLQQESLASLRGSLTPEQIAILAETPLKEYFFYDQLMEQAQQQGK